MNQYNFIIFTIILILLIAFLITIFSIKNRTLATPYFGPPGLVREGFEAEFEIPRHRQVLNNYPYFAATHNPTNYAVINQERIQLKNAEISKHSALKPIGNDFTSEYGCRYSPISYKDDRYKICGAWESNGCNVPK